MYNNIKIHLVVSALAIALLLIGMAQAASIPSLAVLDFERTSDVSESQASVLADQIRMELMGSGEFAVIERGQLNMILQEQSMQASGICNSNECAVQIGQMVGADQIITGSVGRFGSIWVLNLRRIDVATGKVLKMGQTKVKEPIENLLEKGVPEAVTGLMDKADYSDVLNISGDTYSTVKIGEKRWMAQNLNVKTKESWCYDDDVRNCQKHGALYSWRAAMKACPAGWRLPSGNDWEELIQSVGNKGNAGTRMKSTEFQSGWFTADPTNEAGFNGLPSGRYWNNSFDADGQGGYWWSSSTVGHAKAIAICLSYTSTSAELFDADKELGFSIRCIKN